MPRTHQRPRSSRAVIRRVLTALTAAATLAAGLTMATPARAASSALLISEYVEGSGTTKAVELYNPNDAAQSLTGWTLEVYFNGSTSAGTTINLVGTVPGKGTFVVADASLAAYAQQTVTASLWNGDDAIVLKHNGAVVDSFGQVGVDPGTAWGNGATVDHTLRRLSSVCTGDTNPNDTFDPAQQWTVEPKDALDGLGQHSTNCSGGPTDPPDPGTGGATECGATATAIGAVQGSGTTSPKVGATVIVEGVVVGDFQTGGFNGYFVQDAGDGDARTSDGIFVFGSKGPDVKVGDVVRVSGKVSEYQDLTEVSIATATVCGTATLPAPVPLTLPVSPARYEAVEGMRVTLPQSLAILDTYDYARYGSLALGTERQYTPTALYAPGSQQAKALEASNAANRIVVDDGRSSQNPDPAIHPNGREFTLDNIFRAGDLVTGATGILDQRFGSYRLQPTQGATVTTANPRPGVPQVGGDIRVASFNLLNYFTTIGSRGADTPEEFTRQQAKIVAAINKLDADIVGLLEIENNNGVALDTLVAALNSAAGRPKWRAVHTGTIGTDVITTALIYQPAKVHPVDDFALLDSSVDPRFDTTRNRPALLQTFGVRGSGVKINIAVNHLKSKGSSCADDGDPLDPNGQGECNQTRTRAAEALAQWLGTDPTGTHAPYSLIIGDLNSYAKEDPVTALERGGFTNLIAKFAGPKAYSYNFEGLLGNLDHGLANAALLGRITGAAEWNLNADEVSLLDYDMTFKLDAQDRLWAPDPYRSSDHDAVVIGIDTHTRPWR